MDIFCGFIRISIEPMHFDLQYSAPFSGAIAPYFMPMFATAACFSWLSSSWTPNCLKHGTRYGQRATNQQPIFTLGHSWKQLDETEPELLPTGWAATLIMLIVPPYPRLIPSEDPSDATWYLVCSGPWYFPPCCHSWHQPHGWLVCGILYQNGW